MTGGREIIIRTFFLLLGGVLALSTMAQSPHFRKINFNLPLGEPVFQVSMQDSQGFIWLGSDKGLFRFDGTSFKEISSSGDTIGLKISALYQENSGKIWAGCRDGRLFFYENGQLTEFAPEEGTAGSRVSDIVTDGNGALWWSTMGEGIYFFHSGRVYNINHEDGLADDYVYDLEPGPDGFIYAGTDAGISACRQDDGGKTVEVPGINKDLPDVIVKKIKTGPTGNIWLGFHDSGPGFFKPGQPGFTNLELGQDWGFGPVSDLAFPGNAAWIATENGRLIMTDAEAVSTGRILGDNATPSPEYGKIHDLLEDTEGNVWILSASGLYLSSGEKLIFYDRFGSQKLGDIHAIRFEQNRDGKLWFSNDEGLFAAELLEGAARQVSLDAGLKNFKVMSILDDPDGFIWAGTFNYGVFRINPNTGQWIRITEKQGLVNDNVLSISSHDDTLWMATLGGASEIILNNNDLKGPFDILSFNKENGLVSNYIYSVFEDKNDRIWFATDGDGISVLDNGKFISYGKEQGLGDDVVYSIAGDAYGNIWIATASEGVYRYDGSMFTRFGTEKGLSSLEISGLTVGGDEVVIVMENGIDILHIPSERIVHLGEEVDLAGISPDLNVISADPRGNIWIGTKKGIARYSPGSFSMGNGPATILEEIAVFLKPVAMQEGLKLGSNENHVTFQYSGLWYSNPGKISYQVMLEGYDLGWKNTFDRVATYSSLPPGNYTFRVRSSTSLNFMNASEASFAFRIHGPFWLSAWFMVPAILAIAILVYLLVRYRERSLRRRELQKKEKIEFEFQVLKNQVNPHFLFNSFSTLMSLIEEEPEQALQYTEKLSDFFRAILQLKDEEVIPLKEELDLVSDYFFLVRKRYGDNIALETRFDEAIQSSYIPPMTLQILLENAVKHNVISKDRPLKINIYSENDRIIVENNLQPKKTVEVSTGIGLVNIAKRYRLKTDREPSFEMTPEVYRVILPVIFGK